MSNCKDCKKNKIVTEICDGVVCDYEIASKCVTTGALTCTGSAAGNLKDTLQAMDAKICSFAGGPQGVQGVQGIAGAAGTVGPAGLNWQGAWASGTSYDLNDAVGFGGASYYNIAPTSGTTDPATDTASWALLASQGADGVQGIQGVQGASGAGDRYLGEDYNGGIIFELYIGSDGLQHGLIVNKAETLTSWQTANAITNATRSWDGVYNTNLMTNSLAATYVNALTDGGFTDWYLPSIDELNLLYNHRFYVSPILNTGGSTLLTSTSYWSSTEVDVISANYFNFDSGNVTYTKKTFPLSVRAIRAF